MWSSSGNVEMKKLARKSTYRVKPDDVGSLISATVDFRRRSGDIIYDYEGSLTSDPVGPVVKASFTKQIYIIGTTSSTSFSDSWLPPADGLYYYAVTAINGYGESERKYQN
jgi:hypothetical protein